MYRPVNGAEKDLRKNVKELQKEKAEAASYQAGKEALRKLQTAAHDASGADLVLLLKQYGHTKYITESGKTVGRCLDWIAAGVTQNTAKQQLIADYIKKAGIFTPEAPRGQRPGNQGKQNQPKL